MGELEEYSKWKRRGGFKWRKGKRKRREVFLLVSCQGGSKNQKGVVQLGDTTGTRLTTEVITTSWASTRKQS